MNLTEPKVTVLMSVYNGADYLKDAIESVLNQTLREIDFLIIDDASTDDSNAIIRSYQDPRIRILKNSRNIGLTRSLNRGFGEAWAPFIARMDADDISHPSRLERQYEKMTENTDLTLIGTGYRVIDSEGKELRVWELPTLPEYVRSALKEYNCFCHGSVMMHRERVRVIGAYRNEIRHAQDYDLWLRLSERFHVENLADPLYSLRMHENSITSDKLYEQSVSVQLARDLADERAKLGQDGFQRGGLHRVIRIFIYQRKLRNRRARFQHYKGMVLELRKYAEEVQNNLDYVVKEKEMAEKVWRNKCDRWYRIAMKLGYHNKTSNSNSSNRDTVLDG